LSVPIAPVIFTKKVPGVADWHDRVAVPDPVTLFGEISSQVRPDGGVSVRMTVPVKPLIPFRLTVEEATTLTAVLGEVDEILKSVTAIVAVAEWMPLPLVPVTVNV